VIPRIHPRGTSVAGLLYYLFGPGKHEEHTNPRLVAAWDGAGDLAALQPPRKADGKHSLKQLINLLEQPVRAGRRPPDKTAWHCSVRNHATDRILTDQQWQHIAGEIMAAVGLALHGDTDAVRWVAVRHDDYGIHIVATLVRQDGHTAWAWNDRPRARAAAGDLEQRYGLYQVAPADRTAHRRPGAAELNKTRRKGHREIPRDRLRREVRVVAAAATGEHDFFDKLRRAGLLVRLRESTITPGEVTGYAVGLPGHHTAAGQPVWYGGGRLALDLTLPKLRHRWSAPDSTPSVAASMAAQRPNPDERAETFRLAAHAARRAAEDLKNLTASGSHSAATAVAQAAADLLITAGRSAEGRRGGPITDAAEAFDRAARLPNGQPAPRHQQADQLRAMARLIAVTGRLTGDHDTAAALQLMLHLAALAEHLADLRQTQHRLHQVRDARHAARQLRELAQARPASAAHGPLPPFGTGPPARHRTPHNGSSTDAAAGLG
jgi:hypothetical protein